MVSGSLINLPTASNNSALFVALPKDKILTLHKVYVALSIWCLRALPTVLRVSRPCSLDLFSHTHVRFGSATTYTMHEKAYAFLEFLPAEPPESSFGRITDVPAQLPGYPDIELRSVERLARFLTHELECKELDAISDHLWLMTTQSSGNITPLHSQKVKSRSIILSEDPKLHLIWFYDRIHIKPLPVFLFSRRFWQEFLLNDQQLLGARHKAILASALGFLRSYAHLIEYESDFRIAKEVTLQLIPKFVSWNEWRLLRARLLEIGDHDVSGRWKFGQIRLTRLNFYCKFLLRKTAYYRTYRQYGDYFASFYPPLLFLFGIVSVVLGCMQLAATVEQLDEHWPRLLGMFRCFSIFILTMTFSLLASLVTIFTVKIFNEWKYALHCRYWNQRQAKGHLGC
jgi:hypothetical protein